MRRINRVHEKGLPIFDVEDVVTLLAHKREEAFEGERAVRLFQFRTWILFPDSDEGRATKCAELITAAKFLDRAEENYFWDKDSARYKFLDPAEENYFWDEESARLDREDKPTGVNFTHKPPQTLKRIDMLRKDNNAYREIYDRLIGRRGGLLALLDAASPAGFDRAIQLRISQMHIIPDLIDYRLRYIQHGRGNPKVTAHPNGANHNHALFFCWWPTHGVQSSRGRTSPNKSVSPKTMRKWWQTFEESALFIYLIHKHGFRQLPMDTDGGSFIDNLLRESNDTREILQFFGAYAYLVETFMKAHSDLFYVSVPVSIARIPILTPPFSKAELETISQYDKHYLEMTG
ncbi:MAG: hypothetical protein ABSA90_16435 [Xanthobacteraceae bacterium]